MRDLYRRLDIDKDAKASVIAEAAARCHHQALKADVQSVLGVPERRAQYDDIHGLLTDLGHLRVGLGLTHAPHWQGETASDFSLPPRDISRQHQLSLKLEALAPPRRMRHHRIVLCIGALLLFALGISLGRLLA